MKSIEDFLRQCQPTTNQDAAEALMYLTSVSGVVMFAAVGYEETVLRMECVFEAIEEELAAKKNRI